MLFNQKTLYAGDMTGVLMQRIFASVPLSDRQISKAPTNNGSDD